MILVVSYPGEEHTGLVVDRLKRAGREVVQIDLADFPARRTLSCTWSDHAAPRFLIEHDQREIDLANAGAVWWRRVNGFNVDPAIAAGEHQAFAHNETTQAVYGMLDSLGCPWVNPREADAAAHHKPYQWTVARELGLKLPQTLITSHAAAARAFIDALRPKRAVFKPFLASINEWRETRVIEDEDLRRLDLVRYAPVIFQQYVPGVDLRITIIGEKIFAAEIDVRGTSYEFDMRMVVGEGRVRAVELPHEIETKLLALQRRLGLVYGAIDMRRNDRGEYVFLEVNPAGQWLFVEQRTGLPIADAMAEHLGALCDRHSRNHRQVLPGESGLRKRKDGQAAKHERNHATSTENSR
jgi:glutathione synthase/RimK-type ligase-like ATP-grasp enzyme